MKSSSGAVSSKCVVLGTALWGWKVSKKDAFLILDAFFDLGGRLVDTASNYPINQCPEDMGLAAKWVGEWIAQNSSVDVGVWLKMGARDNLGGPNPDLSSEFLSQALTSAQELMAHKVEIAGIHWDNRSGDQAESIKDTVNFLRERSQLGYKVALSGIAAPSEYHSLWPEMADDWLIQVKDNSLTSSARADYAKFFPRAKYYAYGINMGGVKNSAPPQPGSSLALRGLGAHEISEKIEQLLMFSDDMTPQPKSFNDIALMRVFLVEQISGVILGPSSVEQLQESLSFWRALSVGVNASAREKLASVLRLD